MLLYCPETKTVECRVLELPRENDIVRMTAKVHDVGIEMGILRVREFTVPRQYIGLLLDALGPVDANPTPISRYDCTWGNVYPDIAQMTIETKSGKTLRIELYDLGKTVMAFTVDGVRCTRRGQLSPVLVSREYESYADETVLLTEIIGEISRQVETGKHSEKLEPLLVDLRRSLGRIEPERR
jgi:hypothetical protein